MAKDAYWFRHDATSGRGLRMRKMQHIYGHWGKGVYWDVIETLRDQHDYKYENNEQSLQMLSEIIGCKDEGKFLSWYRDCVKYELFTEHEGFFFSAVLNENMRYWETRKQNGSKPKAKRKHKRSKDEAKRENTVHNRDNSIDNIKNSLVAFDSFRILYGGKKRGNQTEFTDFRKHSDWQDVLPNLIEIIKKQIECRKIRKSRDEFVPQWKNLKTWIHQRCWEEEPPEISEIPKTNGTGRTLNQQEYIRTAPLPVSKDWKLKLPE